MSKPSSLSQIETLKTACCCADIYEASGGRLKPKVIAIFSFLFVGIVLIFGFQNCGEVRVGTVTPEDKASETCSDLLPFSPYTIVDDISQDLDLIGFGVIEKDSGDRVQVSSRIYDWYLQDQLIGQGESAQIDKEDLPVCTFREIQARFMACGEEHSLRKSVVRADSSCAELTTTTTSTTTTTNSTTTTQPAAGTIPFDGFGLPADHVCDGVPIDPGPYGPEPAVPAECAEFMHSPSYPIQRDKSWNIFTGGGTRSFLGCPNTTRGLRVGYYYSLRVQPAAQVQAGGVPYANLYFAPSTSGPPDRTFPDGTPRPRVVGAQPPIAVISRCPGDFGRRVQVGVDPRTSAPVYTRKAKYDPDPLGGCFLGGYESPLSWITDPSVFTVNPGSRGSACLLNLTGTYYINIMHIESDQDDVTQTNCKDPSTGNPYQSCVFLTDVNGG